MNYRTYKMVALGVMAGFWALIWAVNSGVGGAQHRPAAAAATVPAGMDTDLSVPDVPSWESTQDSFDLQQPQEQEVFSDPSGNESKDVIYTSAGGTPQKVSAEDLVVLTAAKSSGGSSGSSGSSSSASAVSGGSTGSGPSGGSSGASSSGSSGESSPPAPSTDTVVPAGAGGGTSIQSSLLEELRALSPLPKVHYSWAFPVKFIDNPDSGLMYEVARVTHSIPISGTWLLFNGPSLASKRIDSCVYVCGIINKTNPAVSCSIAVNYSPWHYEFKPELDAPIPKEYNFTIFNDSTYKKEIESFVLRMSFLKQQVEISNQKYGTDVKISAVLLDCERFERRQYDPLWNEGMRKALDDIHVEAVKLFPGVRIEWYGRGIRWGQESSYWTGEEQYIPTLSCSLYSLPKTTDMDQWFQQTCLRANELNIETVVPWIALASGYQYGTGIKLWWDSDWRYDAKYAFLFGQKLNSFTDPFYRRGDVVVFLNPFNSEAVMWEEHFVEYCKGAQGSTFY